MKEEHLNNLLNRIKKNTKDALKAERLELWEEAESINCMMIEEVPCDYKAYDRLADVSMKLNKLSEAADYYDIVTALDKSKKDMTKKAIKLATESQWNEAVLANENIIEDFPWDLEAFNRLGKAYTEMGNKTKAFESFKCALVISPSSVIAKKNLDRLSKRSDVGNQRFYNNISNKSYIEESGKTGITKLVNVPRLIDKSNLLAGDKVILTLSSKGMKIHDANKNDLGNLEPKIGARLRRLIGGGNKYEANVISVDGSNISIIINEVFRSSSQTNVPSFIRKSEGVPLMPGPNSGYSLNDNARLATMKDWTNDDTESGDETGFKMDIPEFIPSKNNRLSEDDY